jgi:hypothetical protein
MSVRRAPEMIDRGFCHNSYRSKKHFELAVGGKRRSWREILADRGMGTCMLTTSATNPYKELAGNLARRVQRPHLGILDKLSEVSSNGCDVSMNGTLESQFVSYAHTVSAYNQIPQMTFVSL